MYLIPIPAFADNYPWLRHDGKRVLAQHTLQLESILVTQHPAGPKGGADALPNATGAQVYGNATERVPEPFAPLHEGDKVHAPSLDFARSGPTGPADRHRAGSAG